MEIIKQRITQEHLEEALYKASSEMSSETTMAWELMARGGPCPKCKAQFGRLDVDLAFGQFTYWMPTCKCFKVCLTVGGRGGFDESGKYDDKMFFWRPGCRKLLIEEALTGSKFCYGCGGELPMPGYDPKIDWKGKKYWSGRDPA
jgi:hypothetical protein